MFKSAILALEDGSVFRGKAVGAEGKAIGEVVFNTSMTGYQEILTDPSYCNQLVTLTYPHIGNYGTNLEDQESDQVWASGLIVRDIPTLASNFRSKETLLDYLKRHNLVAISDIDTRRLTRLLREKGALGGCIHTCESAEEALASAKTFTGLAGVDLAQKVSISQPQAFVPRTALNQSSILNQSRSLNQNPAAPNAISPPFKVVAYDFGAKSAMLHLLAERGCDVTLVPATTSAEQVMALNPDGVFLSNGPGDPAACVYAIEAVTTLLEQKIPIFGICLGHQLLALASGAQTEKMKFGHHGANHPVQDVKSQQVLITSQNHGFAVSADRLPDRLKTTHVSLFDGSLQGIERTDCPAFGFQGHPEASPGPQDAVILFDRFIDMMTTHRPTV